ncbi:MAG: LuxR C-terminal-related transcriptional regulator [Chloroflexota bacterium]
MLRSTHGELPVATTATPSPALEELARGSAALRAGHWTVARDAYAAALKHQDSPHAHYGMAEAIWLLDAVPEAIAHSGCAHATFRRRGDRRQAATVALWLAREHLNIGGRRAISNGWLNRAARLLDTIEPCSTHGWLDWFRAKLAAAPCEQAIAAHRALGAAITWGDIDLQALALSQLGRAHVLLGRVKVGMDELDEAVATATGGEVTDPIVISDTCCNMISACETAADFKRGTEWCQFVDGFTRRANLGPFFARCRQVYASILAATGHWSDAEHELLRAAEGYARSYPWLRIAPLARLATLRVLQGRREEARVLLEGNEGQSGAAQAMATLHLACGELELAAVVARREIAVLGETALVSAPLLALLAEADPDSDAAARLSEIAESTEQRPVAGLAALAMARLDKDPRVHLEQAIHAFAEVGMPYEEGLARLKLAHYVASTDPCLATAEALAALRIFERLGATPMTDGAAELLRRLGVARAGARKSGQLSRREREVLDLIGWGLNNPEIAERLVISRKTTEHHVGSILGKLGLRNRTEAAAYAVRRDADTDQPRNR